MDLGRREDIVAVVRQIALTEGVEAISVRRVAAAAGIGASTLRYYFPTSKDLISALAEDSIDDYLSSEGLNDTSISPVKRIVQLLMQFLPVTDDSLGQLERLLTVYQVAFDSGKLVGASVLRDGALRGDEIVAGWLTELKEQGVTLKVSPQEGAQLLLVFVNGLIFDLIARAPEYTLEAARERLEQAVRLVICEK